MSDINKTIDNIHHSQFGSEGVLFEDTSTGIKRQADGDIEIFTIDGTAAAFGNKKLKLEDGTAAAPSLCAASNEDSGLYVNGATTGISVDGVEKFKVDGTTGNVVVTDAIEVSAGSLIEPSIKGPTNQGFYFDTDDTITVNTGGDDRMVINNVSTTLTHPLHITSTGGPTLPGLSFSGDIDTGIYSIGDGNLGVTCNSTKVVDIDSTSIDTSAPIRAQDGSTTNPVYAFTGNTQMGIWRDASNIPIQLAGNGCLIAASGNHKITFCPRGGDTKGDISMVGQETVKHKIMDWKAWNGGGGQNDYDELYFYVNTQGNGVADNDTNNRMILLKGVSGGTSYINFYKTIRLPTTGGTAGDLDHYEEYTFSATPRNDADTLDFYTTAKTVHGTLVRVGKLVTLQLGYVTGTSQATWFYLFDVIPARFQPKSETGSTGVYTIGDVTVFNGPPTEENVRINVDIQTDPGDLYLGPFSSSGSTVTVGQLTCSWVVA